MNRFHLLSVTDENEVEIPASDRARATTSSLPTPPEVSPAKQRHATSKDKPKNATKFDRRPRGPRKGEGEKHQTVGRGSWGRPLDPNVVKDEGESTAVEEGEATEDRPISTKLATEPKPVYKTVKQFLAEQEEQQRRLRSINAVSTLRRANEDGEGINELEVIKKNNDILIVGAPAVKKGLTNSNAQKESNVIKMTLQDLNRAVPMPASINRKASGTEGQRRHPRSKDTGEGRARRDNRRGPGEAQGQSQRASINLKDEAAFPCLA